MTIPEEQRDKFFDENLRNLVDRHCGGAAAKPEQVARWVDIAAKSKAPVLLRFGAFLRHHPVGSMLSTGIAAAVIVLAVIITFNASSQEISAAEVFSQLDRTLDACPIINIEGKNIEFDGHIVNVRFCGSDEGKRIYAEIQTSPLESNTGDKISADMVFARNGDAGWLLIRKFECNGVAPFATMMADGKSLLVPLPISPESKLTVESVFPQLVRISDIRGLVTSLQAASPDLKTVRRNQSLTQLQGIISSPKKLNVGYLQESIDVSSRVHQRMIPAADDFNSDQATSTDAPMTSKILDYAVDMIMQPLKGTRNSLGKLMIKQRQRQLRRKFIEQLAGAKLTVSYEPENKLLRSIMLTNIGPSRGVLSIHFYGKTFDDSLFSSSRFDNAPAVRVLTRKQLLMGVMTQMMGQ